MQGEVVIIIEDSEGVVFGGYYSANIKISNEFVGTGESFLFKVGVSFPHYS